MRKCVSAFIPLLLAATLYAQPSIVSLSGETQRSGRLIIQGSNFGTSFGQVQIAGTIAPVTRWSDTLIAAYIPESTPLGAATVQVVDANGSASNSSTLNVTARSSPGGGIRWRFRADADYIHSRPAVGPDGTVYAIDVSGHLYALTSDGGLKWIFNASGYGFGNVSIGADGTVYVGSTTHIYAIRPDGTAQWQFDQNPSALILLGPNVGPDGNIYAIGTQGLGVFSLTPFGALRWAVLEQYDRPIVILQEIVFGPAGQPQLYFHANDHLRGIGLDGTPLFTYVDGLPQDEHQPAVAPDGSLYTNLFSAFGPGLMMGKFDDNGNLLWHIFDQFPDSTNALSAPDVGPDGVIYNGRNLNTLYAINPDSSVRWRYQDSGILFAPVVSPRNDLIFVGGIVTYGQPGFLAGVNTSGSLLFKVLLPLENGGNIVPMSRSRFAADGLTAYIGTSIPGQPSDNMFSYLYAVDTSGGTSTSTSAALAGLSITPMTVVGGNSATGRVTLSAAAPSGGTVVKLASNKANIAAVPATVTVPAGASSASFTVSTARIRRSTTVTITASLAGVSKSVPLTVTR